MRSSLMALILVGAGCTCTKGGDSTAGADAVAFDTAQDFGRDAPRDQRGDRPLWPLDIGPVPDANTALCKDAWYPDAKPAADAPASLAVKPAIKFKTLLGKATFGIESVPLLGPDGNIHILTQSGIFGVSSDGQVKWSVSPPVPSFGFGTNPMTLNGQWLVFGTNEGINGLSRTGVGDWLVPFKGTVDPGAPPGSDVTSAPALDGKGNVLIAGPDHLLYRIQGKGNLLGTSQLPGRAWGQWHPLVDGQGNVYFGIRGPVIRVVSVSATGKVRWDRKVMPSTSSGGLAALVLAANGDLLVNAGQYIWQKPPLPGIHKSYVVSLDSACGVERWRTSIFTGVAGLVLVGPGANLYFQISSAGDAPSKLVSLSPQGKPRWSTELENSHGTGLLTFAAVGPLGADGVIYTLIKNSGPKDDPSGPPQVRAYSMANGKELWKLPIEWMQISSSYPLLRTDGMLIFGASFPDDPVPGSYLVGVQTPSPGMPVAPWPRLRHDNQSSGNVSTKLP